MRCVRGIGGLGGGLAMDEEGAEVTRKGSRVN